MHNERMHEGLEGRGATSAASTTPVTCCRDFFQLSIHRLHVQDAQAWFISRLVLSCRNAAVRYYRARVDVLPHVAIMPECAYKVNSTSEGEDLPSHVPLSECGKPIARSMAIPCLLLGLPCFSQR